MHTVCDQPAFNLYEPLKKEKQSLQVRVIWKTLCQLEMKESLVSVGLFHKELDECKLKANKLSALSNLLMIRV